MNRGRVTDEPPLHHQMIYHNCLVPCCSTPHRFNHNFIPEQEKKEAQIENNTTASKIAIQASAKERRGTSKHKNQSRAGSKSLDNKQARRTPSKVLQMESSILNFLKFELITPTVRCFLRRFVCAAHVIHESGKAYDII
ncbi:uncharacterized protein LOC110912867 isoform X2 [Helianthus annuus]|uniref:uncharacterized protein LOC110912867 isoform X2 n=1 Tax=Helianthus annuus TaxID=4232 RepID=UPI000B8F0595|nr:uncharacterized protein LOC110912867 isoform X2 [Helianthus annuus]